MPLSREEQRQLEELEASLAEEDPRLAHAMGAKTPRRVHGRRAGLAGFGFLIGLVMLVAGMQTFWLVSVLGFIGMFVSTVIAINAWQQATHPGNADKPRKGPGGPSRDPFMTRMEDRWRRRQQGQL